MCVFRCDFANIFLQHATEDTKLSPTVANDNTVVCYVCHVSLPTKQAPHPGKGSFEVLDKTLGGNVVKKKSFLEILEEPVKETVAIPDGQVTVKQVEIKQLITGLHVSTTNFPKAEDDQSVTVSRYHFDVGS